MALTFRVKSIEEKPGSGLCNAEIPGFFGVAVFILCLIKEKAGICLSCSGSLGTQNHDRCCYSFPPLGKGGKGRVRKQRTLRSAKKSGKEIR